ncbi:MAG: pyridoxal phosphate-dependent aminotransferase [Oscillospiraceae bacterium]|nr:pyridoxal phosphate-dependent aminotransferase [Oscillospiraceae bacterium]
MISNKMAALAQNNSVIRAMFEEGNRLAAQFGRENVFDFSLGNPNFPPPEAVKSAIRDVLDDTSPVDIHGYMSNAGFPAVREAVAHSINRRHGTSFSSGNIIMSVGAAGALNSVLKTLLNPGDEVAAFAPYFVEYGNYVANYDGALKVAPPNIPTFQPSAESLETVITAKTRAVIINTPNNPTGVIYSEESLRAIARVLTKKSKEFGAPIYLISDEPYRELAYDGVCVPYVTKLYPDTFVCYSWSKSLSLPGERIGYIVIPSELEDFSLIFDAVSIATRVLGFVNAPSLIQLAVARCLEAQTDICAYDQNRRALYDGLTSLGFECVFPQGAFYMWVKAPGGDDKAFVAAAKDENILFVPGTSFACPGYARIAYCVAKSTIERSMPGFKKIAAKLGVSK